MRAPVSPHAALPQGAAASRYRLSSWVWPPRVHWFGLRALLVHANYGEDMAIAPAIRKTAGSYPQTGEIPARFIAVLLSI